MRSGVTLTGDEAAAVAGLLGLSATTLLLLFTAYVVLLIIARWKIFAKAGQQGWKSLIPIYSDYVEWKIGWKKIGFFWLVIVLVVVGVLLGYFDGTFALNHANGHLAYSGVTGPLGAVGSILILVALIFDVIAAYKLFASFGHGVGWVILDLIAPSIMLLVLGFGSSEYQGARD